jgi:hypothetical protein
MGWRFHPLNLRLISDQEDGRYLTREAALEAFIVLTDAMIADLERKHEATMESAQHARDVASRKLAEIGGGNA